jgi:hypothetical protein
MYTLSPFSSDTVAPLGDVPQPSVESPCPIVLADDGQLFVLYVLKSKPEGWYDSWVKMTSSDSEGEPFAIIVFHRPLAYYLGIPDDEALHGHPLYRRGLRPHGAFEIENSSWQGALLKMRGLQAAHRIENYHRYRHFVLAFRDTTLECLAESYSIRIGTGSIRDAAEKVLSELQ